MKLHSKQLIAKSRASWLTAVFLLFAGALAASEVTGLTLVNAANNSDIQTLTDGATIDLAVVGTSLNIRANTNPATVGSVRFGYDSNANFQIENMAPYALAGDSSGNYNVWTPTLGTHTLTVTPYDGTNASGTAGTALTVTFTVVDGETPPPPPPPTEEDGDGTVTISGALQRWHKVTLDLAGPYGSETGDPNPFLDYRMEVVFTNGDLSYTVPGYFAADGDAANTGATAGTTWRAHLSPDRTGTWSYTVRFYAGDGSALGGGTALAPYDGQTGAFSIAETDKTGRDLRGKGRLQYVGKHHLRFAGTGEYFLKCGADAPENFLAYAEFDGSFKNDGTKDDLIKTWSPHVGDWQTGDPTWAGGKGKGIIGAVDYLAGKGMNVFSFLTMNMNGDDRNVFPYLTASERYRMDCSRLDQWEVVFAHADAKGMYLHFKTQETENDQLLDGGALGTQRKLYYRELIARFGHHLALNWNLGEENTNTDTQRKAFAQYFHDLDPYDHNIVLHTYPGQQESIYRPLLGDASALTGVSIQIGKTSVHAETKQWVSESAAAGRPWVVANDEQGGANDGVVPDANDYNHDIVRKEVLWGNIMAGGAGVEYYFGYSYAHSDLTCEDFRSRDHMWDLSRYCLVFFQDNAIPFWSMVNDNGKSSASDDYCLYQEGAAYVVYLKNGGTTALDLTGVNGTFEVKWFDPRNGGALQNGTVTSVTGGGNRPLGSAPNNTTEDWAILVRLTGTPPVNQPPVVNAGTDATIVLPADPVSLDGTVSDDGLPDGTLTTNWSRVSGPGTVAFADASALETTATFSAAGSYVLQLNASDGELTGSDTVAVTVESAPVPPPDGAVVFAVNAGGPAYTAVDGTVYAADSNVTGGKTFTRADPIAGTEDDTLYQSERYGNFSYAISLPDGTYSVTMQMAEIYWTSAGKRVFNVTVEGVEVVTNLDLYATVGHDAAHDVTVTTTVNDGTLNIVFSTDVDNAKVSALCVRAAGDGPVNEAPVADAGTDSVEEPGYAVSLDGSASSDPDAGPHALTYAWTQVSGPAVVIENAGQAVANVTFADLGDYVFQLTVSDGVDTATDTVSISVIDSTPPLAEVTAVTLRGTVEDLETAVVSVTVNGAAATLDGNTWSRDVTLVDGTNTFDIVATDSEGNTATMAVALTK